MCLLHQQEQPNNLTQRTSALSTNLPALYSTPSSRQSRIDAWIFSLGHTVGQWAFILSRLVLYSVDWIKWKAGRCYPCGWGKSRAFPLSAWFTWQTFCAWLPVGSMGKAVGWRETGFPRHHTGSARDGSLQDTGTVKRAASRRLTRIQVSTQFSAKKMHSFIHLNLREPGQVGSLYRVPNLLHSNSAQSNSFAFISKSLDSSFPPAFQPERVQPRFKDIISQLVWGTYVESCVPGLCDGRCWGRWSGILFSWLFDAVLYNFWLQGVMSKLPLWGRSSFFFFFLKVISCEEPRLSLLKSQS